MGSKNMQNDALHGNVSKGIVLGKATSDGLGLYEPGLAPVVGVNLSEVKPQGVNLDKGYDQIQAMTSTPEAGNLFENNDGLAAIKGLLGGDPPTDAPLPPEWHPKTTALTRFLLPYAASIWDSTPISEVLEQNDGKVVNRKPKIVGNYSRGE